MRLKKLVLIGGFCTVSFFPNLAAAHSVWVVDCQTRQCLEVDANGVNGVQVSDCTTSKDTQQWDVQVRYGIPETPIENVSSKQCLSMVETLTNFEVVTSSCDDDAKAQKWEGITGIVGSTEQLKNSYFKGRCVAVDEKGTTVVSVPCEKSVGWEWVEIGGDVGDPRRCEVVVPSVASSVAAPSPYCSTSIRGFCTKDINKCGHPSNCNCGINPDYVYNPATGNCDLRRGAIQ